MPQWAPEELLHSSVPHRLSQDTNSRHDKVLFRFAGSIGTMQNLEIVLRAFAEAKAKNHGLAFEIIGDGSEKRRLECLARELSVDGVVFTGRASR